MSSHYYQARSSFSFAPGQRLTFAVQALILGTAAVFAVQLVHFIPFGASGLVDGYLSWLGFRPDRLMRGAIWQPLSYMFLHGSLSHLFFNLLSLYFFGPDVERILSTRQFFRFYLICGGVGVLPVLGLWFLRPGVTPAVVGASGAVLGVLVAFAIAYPDREIFLFPLPFPINARALVLLFVVLNIVNAFRESSTSVATHFGGMATGAAYMWLTPRIRSWRATLGSRGGKPRSPHDPVGDAVDNIFRFDEEKKRRK